MSDIYNATPRTTYRYIKMALEAGLVPFVRSSPGIGKSSLFRKAATEFGLWMIDHRVSTSAPEDFTGLPEFVTRDAGTPYERRVATFTPFDLFPIEATPIPENYEGWLVFLDEFNSAEKEMQAPAYKLILDRLVGQFPLHKRVAMGAAGNLITDRAIVTEFGTAMQSRLVTIDMVHSYREWLEDVALAEDYDERIIAYLAYDNDALMDFRPDHQDKTFCCPRTWEFMNRAVKGKDIKDEDTGFYAGTITSTHAAGFVQFSKIFTQIATIEDVLRDPSGVPVPDRSEQEKKWAMVTSLMKKVTEENFTAITTYIDRFPDTVMRVLFYRGALATQPVLRRHPAYAKAMIDMQQYLRDEPNGTGPAQIAA